MNSLEAFSVLSPVFTAGIFMVGFLALIFGFMYFFDSKRETRMNSLESKVDQVKTDLSQVKTDLSQVKTDLSQRIDSNHNQLLSILINKKLPDKTAGK